MPTSKMCDNTQLLTYVAEDNFYGPVISQINRNGTPKLITVPEKERFEDAYCTEYNHMPFYRESDRNR